MWPISLMYLSADSTFLVSLLSWPDELSLVSWMGLWLQKYSHMNYVVIVQEQRKWLKASLPAEPGTQQLQEEMQPSATSVSHQLSFYTHRHTHACTHTHTVATLPGTLQSSDHNLSKQVEVLTLALPVSSGEW